ncbi:hypothetical protein L6452_34822 [Arctium lappa]|uniref:Uncharacterized protein n=1 Tax=Arctium lappa TaxID=4217 RepID=A0ACB8YIH8_ARCLA|nr:hypothetical protein L6452_34822 [Arctium lappa]
MWWSATVEKGEGERGSAMVISTRGATLVGRWQTTMMVDRVVTDISSLQCLRYGMGMEFINGSWSLHEYESPLLPSS